MSENPSSPDRKPLIAGVLVTVAVAVMAFNVLNFGPGQKRPPRTEARVQSYLSVPSDLAETLADARRRPDLAAVGQAPLPRLARDPFVSRRALPAAAVPPEETGDDAAPAPLACQAVFLGGAKPSALIAGRTVRAGDRIDGHRVVDVSARGVELDGPDGGIFLPVGGASGAVSRVSNEQKRTATGGLVEYLRSERNQP